MEINVQSINRAKIKNSEVRLYAKQKKLSQNDNFITSEFLFRC